MADLFAKFLGVLKYQLVVKSNWFVEVSVSEELSNSVWRHWWVYSCIFQHQYCCVHEMYPVNDFGWEIELAGCWWKNQSQFDDHSKEEIVFEGMNVEVMEVGCVE